MLAGDLTTDPNGGTGPGWRPPDAADQPDRQPAAGGGQPRPRGRRYSGRVPARPGLSQAAAPAGPRPGLAGGTPEPGRGEGPAAVPGSPRAGAAAAGAAGLAWARRQQPGLSSATGISLALAGIAAGWFSAGRPGMLPGAAALWCSYLVLAAGRSLAPRPGGPRQAAAGARPGPVTWLPALGLAVAEAGALAGLVLGAETARRPAPWAAGTWLLGLVAVRAVMTACSQPRGLGRLPDTPLGRAAAAAVTMAPGARILVLGAAAALLGARMALLVLLGWGAASICYGLAGRPAALAAGAPGGRARPPVLIRRLRDDGELARALGRLVRGKLVPLPPVLLGLAVVAALAVVGLRGLAGPLFLAAPGAMLLAAPGSASPHAGRPDWLAPAALVSAQVLYLQSAAAGARAPGPVAFITVAALLLRYTDLSCADRPVLLAAPRPGSRARREQGTALGWEGRMLAAGLAAALGIAAFGYLALAAYLAVLVGAKLIRAGIAEPAEDLSARRA